MQKRLTSFGWIWTKPGQPREQYAAQVGHEWNGEYPSVQDRRVLRRLKA